MKKPFFVLLLLAVFAAAAQTPQAPDIAAKSYLLMDVTADQVLAQKEADLPIEPGSLTKLMVAYVVFDAVRARRVDLAQTLPVSAQAASMPGPRMFLAPDMQVPVDDLIKGMLVQSGNDATLALAEGVGGSVAHFVQMMNDQAKALGLQSTSYKNPQGLAQAGHVTTARDLSVLAARLMRDFPQRMPYFAIKKYHYPGTPAANETNRNLLLFRDPSVDGLNTGQTDTAGFCLVASAQRQVSGLGAPGAAALTPQSLGTRRLVAVVLGASGASERANEAQKLLNWGYTAFGVVKLFDAGQVVTSPTVWKGTAPTVDLVSQGAVVMAVGQGDTARWTTQVVHAEPLVAPIGKGQQLALLKISSGGHVVREVPLVARSGVSQAGLLVRAWDGLRLWIK